mgnify:CR=1 FL=1
MESPSFAGGIELMALTCSFKFNGKLRSFLTCHGLGSFPAYSGHGHCIDNPRCSDVPNIGPLPPGRYFILDRGGGGLLSHIRDRALAQLDYSDHRQWFALYRDDAHVDDVTFINGVRRGAFRLHPDGPLHYSEGCLTVAKRDDFDKIAKYLHKQGANLPTPAGMAYGSIEVRA